MEDTRGATDASGKSGDYEAPQVFDLGSVFDVTLGSSAGSGDSNGQAHI